MELAEAWKLFGRNLGDIVAAASRLPRPRRAAYLEECLEAARKDVKKLQRDHHPDRGGDPAKFKAVAVAIALIEKNTKEFRERMETAEVVREAERVKKRSVFIKVE